MPPHDLNDSDKQQPYRDAMVFRDAAGAQWFVHEVSGDALGGGPPSLLLVSAQQVRRVSQFPADWRRVTPEALLELPYSRL